MVSFCVVALCESEFAFDVLPYTYGLRSSNVPVIYSSDEFPHYLIYIENEWKIVTYFIR